jgi:hypothetical protein
MEPGVMTKPRYRWDYACQWWCRWSEGRFEAYWAEWSIDAYH